MLPPFLPLSRLPLFLAAFANPFVVRVDVVEILQDLKLLFKLGLIEGWILFFYIGTQDEQVIDPSIAGVERLLHCYFLRLEAIWVEAVVLAHLFRQSLIHLPSRLISLEQLRSRHAVLTLLAPHGTLLLERRFQILYLLFLRLDLRTDAL